MLIENIHWPEGCSETLGEVIVTGVVRGKGLKADRLVHIPGWGDYQISSIVASPLPSARSGREDAMNVDDLAAPQILDQPGVDCDDLALVAPEEVMMADDTVSMADASRKGVLLDDHHYFSEDDERVTVLPKRLPKGTSKYQSAWYLDDVSDSGSDIVDDIHDGEGDILMATEAGPEDGVFDPGNRDGITEAGPSEYPQSEMFLDPSPEDEVQQLEDYRARRRTEAKDDLEFPDEIELHPTTLAKERFARYRGLNSFKNSTWEIEEDKAHEPEDWRRLLQIANYKRSKNQNIREALAGGVKPGTRADVHLRDVSLSLKALNSQPLSLFSLLRHEHKHTVVNINITLSSAIENPIKSKDELCIQCGPRRLIIKPIFSTPGTTPNNVHKFDRYLHPGRNAIATYIGPVTWGAIPVLIFKSQLHPDSEILGDRNDNPNISNNLQLIGTGTTMAPDQSRVIAKRVILTGHPYKIHKKLVTVRYMFFNSEDVKWFKALQLWTKRGRNGFIKESLGTHGYFKATFDSRINPQDAVGISLYKRVFPRKAIDWENKIQNRLDVTAVR
jgi:pre-rRNA-processing protein TSR1